MLTHTELLKLHCRICGQKKIDPQKSRGVPIKSQSQLCRWLRYLHDLDVERESEEIYPSRSCDACVSKLRNVCVVQKGTKKKAADNVFELAVRLHTEGSDDELRKLARHFPAADFWAHSSDGMCAICDDSQKDAFGEDRDPKLGLLIEVENAPSGIKIDQCTYTKDLPISTGGPAKPKPMASSSATSSGTAGSAGPSTSTVWQQFNEALGRQRKQRADKLSDILKTIVADSPKILSDLKSSGIEYKSSVTTRHFKPTDDYNTNLAVCVALIESVAVPKRALMIFRAITDTASDGQLNILDHTGIHIDLGHSNMGFLVRRIKSKNNGKLPATALQSLSNSASPYKKEAKKKDKKVKPGSDSDVAFKSKASASSMPGSRDRPARRAGAPTNYAAETIDLSDNDDDYVPSPSKSRSTTAGGKTVYKLPSGITISKIKSQSSGKPGPKSKKKGYAYIPIEESEVPDSPSESMLIPRADEADEPIDESNLTQDDVDSIKVSRAFKDLNKNLPVNRQMRADVIFDFLHTRNDSPSLLSLHGIIYNPKIGKHHTRALGQQRKTYKSKMDRVLAKYNKFEWAEVVARLIFELLHTEDTLTLRMIGIMIDPFHAAAPLSFRLGFMLKHFLVSDDNPNLAKDVMNTLLQMVEINPKAIQNKRSVEDALVTMLYCNRSQAQDLISPVYGRGKGSSARMPASNSRAPVKIPLMGAGKKRKQKITYKEDYDGYDSYDEDAVLKAPAKKRGRKTRVKQEPDDDDDYTPTSSVKGRGKAAKTPTPERPKRKYNKSQAMIEKQLARGTLRPSIMRASRKVIAAAANSADYGLDIDPLDLGTTETATTSSSSLPGSSVVMFNQELEDPLAVLNEGDPVGVDIKSEPMETEESGVLSTIIEAHDNDIIVEGENPPPAASFDDVAGSDKNKEKESETANDKSDKTASEKEASKKSSGDKDSEKSPEKNPLEDSETADKDETDKKEYQDSNENSNSEEKSKSDTEESNDKNPLEDSENPLATESEKKSDESKENNEAEDAAEKNTEDKEPSPAGFPVPEQKDDDGVENEQGDDPLGGNDTANDQESGDKEAEKDPFASTNENDQSESNPLGDDDGAQAEDNTDKNGDGQDQDPFADSTPTNENGNDTEENHQDSNKDSTEKKSGDSFDALLGAGDPLENGASAGGDKNTVLNEDDANELLNQLGDTNAD